MYVREPKIVRSPKRKDLAIFVTQDQRRMEGRGDSKIARLREKPSITDH
jgi:hypothetical protein